MINISFPHCVRCRLNAICARTILVYTLFVFVSAAYAGAEGISNIPETMTLAADKTNNYRFEVLIEYAVPGNAYTIHASNVNVIAGTADYASVILYDFTTKQIITQTKLSIVKDSACSIFVPTDVKQASILLYAGVAGQTAGVELCFEDLIVEETPKSFLFSAENMGNEHIELIRTPIAGALYTLDIGSTELIQGSAESAALLLYDHSNRALVTYQSVQLNKAENQQFTIRIPCDLINEDLSLLLYDGAAGATYDNSIQLNEISISDCFTYEFDKNRDNLISELSAGMKANTSYEMSIDSASGSDVYHLELFDYTTMEIVESINIDSFPAVWKLHTPDANGLYVIRFVMDNECDGSPVTVKLNQFRINEIVQDVAIKNDTQLILWIVLAASIGLVVLGFLIPQSRNALIKYIVRLKSKAGEIGIAANIGKELPTVKERLIAYTLVGLLSIFPVVFLFCVNINDIRSSDYVVIFGIACGYFLLGVFLMFVGRLFLRNVSRRALLVSGAMVTLLVFQNIRSIIAVENEGISYLLATAIIAVLLLFIHRNLVRTISHSTAKLACGILLLSLCTLTVMNIVSAVITSGSSMGQQDDAYGIEELIKYAPNSEKTFERPNLYFMLFDEYAGFEEIKAAYGYDNAEFYQFLCDQNFNISLSTRNHSLRTLYVLSDLLNLRHQHYENDVNENILTTMIQNGRFQELLKWIGYDLYETEDSNMFKETNRLTTDDNLARSVTSDGKSIVAVLLETSVFASLVEPIEIAIYGEQATLKGGAAGILDVFDYYAIDEHYNYTNAATFTYLCTPHTPFLFKSDGSRYETNKDSANWLDHTFYLEQYKFITTKITETVLSILRNDPNSVIILMSDHGARNHYDHFEKFNAASDLQFNTLEAVYFGGKSIDIEGMCGEHILRTVLNEVYGFTLPMDECQ